MRTAFYAVFSDLLKKCPLSKKLCDLREALLNPAVFFVCFVQIVILPGLKNCVFYQNIVCCAGKVNPVILHLQHYRNTIELGDEGCGRRRSVKPMS